MQRYLVTRLLAGLVTLFIVSIVVFSLLRVIGGDPALLLLLERSNQDASRIDQEALRRLRAELGTDQPLYVQYGVWLKQLATFDLGKSLVTGQPIADEIKLRFPFTLQFALISVVIGACIGLSLGVLAAIKQDTWIDYVARVFMILGISMPVFWTATLIILFLLVFFKWFPPLGYALIWQNPLTAVQQLVWPALILGYSLSAIISRMTRSQMLEVLRQDYIRTAWAKGLSQRVVLLRHAIRNAMLPVVTIIGLQFAVLLGGTVILEAIFIIPGMGTAFIEGLRGRDYPMVQNIIMLFATIILLTNLLVDIMYSVLDPRIRYD